MKLNKIKKNIVGKTYSYKELCELFGEEVLKNSSGRFQRKRFLQVINYEQKGHKYTITRIKEKELKKIKLNKDGYFRGKNKNSLKNLEKGRVSPYKVIDDLFMVVLSSHSNKITTDENGNTYFSSFDYLVCDTLKVLNRNFKWSKYRKAELFKYLKDRRLLSNTKSVIGYNASTLLSSRDKMYIELYLKDLNRKISGAINSSLIRLNNNNIIDLFDMNGYYILTTKKRSEREGEILEEDLEPATEEMVHLILEARLKALLEMNLIKSESIEKLKNKNKELSSSLGKVYKNNKLVKEFNSLCCKHIYQLSKGEISYFAKRVYINFNEISLSKIKGDVDSLNKNINNLLQDRMISDYIKKDSKRLRVYENLNKVVADLDAKDILDELEEIGSKLKENKKDVK